MTRVLRLLAALTVLAILTAAEGCQVQTNRPPWERQCVGEHCRTANIYVDCSGPCEITIHVIQKGTDKFDRTGPVPTAGGRFAASVVYPTGMRLEIAVEVKSHRQDVVQCIVEDGPGNRVVDRRSRSVSCLLTTRQ